ncbi:GerAB/ArcD/ProY family transporter (plasmid) [Paenibacillus rhizovicinus]|uniref:GerAB/ArcD/ProY family transporter n=1 Tax=Paenibacillus rhizovicinus TaxID=2704463 RepID=A0A6C0PAL7_9BACL|nr:GerAB/ArcD/ProY family transporter [Paenibacillus rhizovicinus]QHW35587.1 GerAB/ArcD/ProY family transporter [Paenibacillus rhizovicinus]
MSKTRQTYMYSSFLLIFIIHDAQVGVGLPGYQRVVYQLAGHDAWITVLITGIITQLVVWMMIKTLAKFENKDLYDIHLVVYGKFLGNVANLIYTVYFLFATIIVMRNYIEMIQVWLFPNAPTWVLTLLIASIVFYGVTGGLRTIVGACFIFVTITIWLIFLLYFPLKYADWTGILPILETDMSHLSKGVLSMSFTMAGFEILYFIYAYAKDKSKVQRYSQIGLMSVTFVYTVVMFVTIVFYSGGELLKTDWATFTMLKIIKFSFLERFEYIGVSLWLLVIVPNLLMYSWAATRGLKRTFAWKQKYWLYVFIGVACIACSLIESRIQINRINNLFSKLAVYIVYVYPVVLFVIVNFHSWKQKKRSHTEVIP